MTDPAKDRHLAALAAWRALPEAEQLARVAAPPAARPDARPRRPRAALDFLDLVRRDADTCPFGSGPCGCLGGPPRSCSRPGRPAEVRRPECLRCVARDRWESQPM